MMGATDIEDVISRWASERRAGDEAILEYGSFGLIDQYIETKFW